MILQLPNYRGAKLSCVWDCVVSSKFRGRKLVPVEDEVIGKSIQGPGGDRQRVKPYDLTAYNHHPPLRSMQQCFSYKVLFTYIITFIL